MVEEQKNTKQKLVNVEQQIRERENQLQIQLREERELRQALENSMKDHGTELKKQETENKAANDKLVQIFEQNKLEEGNALANIITLLSGQELNELKSQVAKDKRENESKQRKMEGELKKAKSEAGESAAELKKAKEEIAKIREVRKRDKSEQDEMISKAKWEQVNSEKNQLKQKCTYLQGCMNQHNSEYTIKVKEYIKMKKHIGTLEEQIKHRNKAVNRAAEKIKTLEQHVSESGNRNDKLHEELKQAVQKATERGMQITEITKLVMQKDTESWKIRKEVESLRADISDVNKRVEEEEIQRRKLSIVYCQAKEEDEIRARGTVRSEELEARGRLIEKGISFIIGVRENTANQLLNSQEEEVAVAFAKWITDEAEPADSKTPSKPAGKKRGSEDKVSPTPNLDKFRKSGKRSKPEATETTVAREPQKQLQMGVKDDDDSDSDDEMPKLGKGRVTNSKEREAKPTKMSEKPEQRKKSADQIRERKRQEELKNRREKSNQPEQNAMKTESCERERSETPAKNESESVSEVGFSGEKFVTLQDTWTKTGDTTGSRTGTEWTGEKFVTTESRSEGEPQKQRV